MGAGEIVLIVFLVIVLIVGVVVAWYYATRKSCTGNSDCGDQWCNTNLGICQGCTEDSQCTAPYICDTTGSICVLPTTGPSGSSGSTGSTGPSGSSGSTGSAGISCTGPNQCTVPLICDLSINTCSIPIGPTGTTCSFNTCPVTYSVTETPGIANFQFIFYDGETGQPSTCSGVSPQLIPFNHQAACHVVGSVSMMSSGTLLPSLVSTIPPTVLPLDYVGVVVEATDLVVISYPPIQLPNNTIITGISFDVNGPQLTITS